MLCYVMESITTDETAWFLMGLEFLGNLLTCLRIVWLNKQRPMNIDKQIDLLQKLVVNELVEFMAPLAFLLSFVVAYYGPNSNIIGNVCANVWQYKKVEDINETMGTIFLFFFTDFSSVVVCAIILRVVCKINIFKAFIATEKEFGIVLCIILGYFLTTVNNGFIYCFKN